MQELFLEDVLRLTGFKNMDMKKYKEETQRSMALLLISPLNRPEWKRNVSQPALWFDFLCVSHTIWFSEEKKQKRLTEWCKAVENSSFEEEQRTSVIGQDLLQDSSSLERGDTTFNKPVKQNAPPTHTHTTD